MYSDVRHFLVSTTTGLDVGGLDSCVKNHHEAGTARADEALGRSLGVHPTPTFFIDEMTLKGLRTADQLYEAVRKARGIANRPAEVSLQLKCNRLRQGSRAESHKAAVRQMQLMNKCSFSSQKSRMTLLSILFLACLTLEGAQDKDKDKEQFLDSVRAVLPTYSAVPPVTDLATALAPTPLVNRAWEEKYQNMEGLIRRDVTELSDDPSAVGGLAIDTKEESGGVALPARDSSAVVIGTALSSASHIASNKHLVYSDYQLRIKRRLNGPSVDFGSENSSINVILFGGGIRFPTGYTEYFVITGSGFLENGKTGMRPGLNKQAGSELDRTVLEVSL